MKKYAQIFTPYVSDDINFLILEDDILDTKGYFLYLHKSLYEPCLYDNWFQKIEHVLNYSKEAFGVNEDDWKDFEQ